MCAIALGRVGARVFRYVDTGLISFLTYSCLMLCLSAISWILPSSSSIYSSTSRIRRALLAFLVFVASLRDANCASVSACLCRLGMTSFVGFLVAQLFSLGAFSSPPLVARVGSSLLGARVGSSLFAAKVGSSPFIARAGSPSFIAGTGSPPFVAGVGSPPVVTGVRSPSLIAEAVSLLFIAGVGFIFTRSLMGVWFFFHFFRVILLSEDLSDIVT